MINTRGLDAVLFGLGHDLASDLTAVLTRVCRQVRTASDTPVGAKVIFCPSDPDHVTRLRAAVPQASIIVVTRHPEYTDWLDSIEAGADDYCAAPFEPSQLQWILQSTMRAGQLAVA